MAGKNYLALTLVSAALGLAPVAAVAAGNGGMGVTMQVVNQNDATEQQFVDQIELPKQAAQAAQENAQQGLDTANGARQREEPSAQEATEPEQEDSQRPGQITLPEQASEDAQEHAQEGLETANQARQQAQDAEQQAEEAQQQAQEAQQQAQDVQQQAQQAQRQAAETQDH